MANTAAARAGDLLTIFKKQIARLSHKLETVDDAMLNFLDRLPAGSISAMIGNGSAIGRVVGLARGVFGLITAIHEGAENVTLSPGLGVLAELHQKSVEIQQKVDAFLDGKVIATVITFANVSEAACDCAVYVLTTVVGKELAATVDGVQPTDDPAACRTVQDIVSRTALAATPANNATSANNTSSLVETFQAMRVQIDSVLGAFSSLLTEPPTGLLFQALGNPPDLFNLVRGLALAVNFTSTGEGNYTDWELDALSQLLANDFDAAAATIELQVKVIAAREARRQLIAVLDGRGDSNSSVSQGRRRLAVHTELSATALLETLGPDFDLALAEGDLESALRQLADASSVPPFAQEPLISLARGDFDGAQQQLLQAVATFGLDLAGKLVNDELEARGLSDEEVALVSTAIA